MEYLRSASLGAALEAFFPAAQDVGSDIASRPIAGKGDAGTLWINSYRSITLRRRASGFRRRRRPQFARA